MQSPYLLGKGSPKKRHIHFANKNSYSLHLFVFIHFEEWDFTSSKSFIRAIFFESLQRICIWSVKPPTMMD